jgi:shikimate kinase
MTPGQLKSRLAESSGERPLLKGLNDNALLDFIEEKLSMREKYYNRAEITVEGYNLNISFLHSLVNPILNL